MAYSYANPHGNSNQHFIDFFDFLLPTEKLPYITAFILLLISNVLTGLGVYIMTETKLIMDPGNGIIETMCSHFKKPFSYLRVRFDISLVIFTCLSGLIIKGQIVKAKVGLIISSGMNGIPASIVFEDFKIDNVENGKLQNTLEVFGQDRSLIVFPIKWALTILPPTGSLTNFIMGGHARIRQGKTFTIYYHPEWL